MTGFNLEKWESENRSRIAAYYQTRDQFPDDYDPADAMTKATGIFSARYDNWDRPDDMNLWTGDLAQDLYSEEIWEFLDYDDFENVIRRGSLEMGHKHGEVRVRTLNNFRLKHYPTSVKTSMGHYPIWGVIDVLVLPSKFNNLKTELDPHGIPYNLLRWLAIVTPRTKRLSQSLGRSILHCHAYTTWQRMTESLKYQRQLWSDNYRPN